MDRWDRAEIAEQLRFLLWYRQEGPQRREPRLITSWYRHPGVSYHRAGLAGDDTGDTAVWNADRDMAFRRRAERIQEALDRLPDRLRWAVWEHYGEGRAANELATEAGRCRRTVHRWITLGLEMLAADLPPQREEARPVPEVVDA